MINWIKSEWTRWKTTHKKFAAAVLTFLGVVISQGLLTDPANKYASIVVAVLGAFGVRQWTNDPLTALPPGQ